jgi:hypothetical protein
MIELIKNFIINGGPLIGPAILSIVIVNMWLINRVERRDALHHIRLNYALLDKKIMTYDEMVKYQLITDSMADAGILGALK